jgi:putative DNA primase/helicase
MAPPTATAQSHADAIARFIRIMADAGIVTHDPVIADGALHRVHVEGQKPGSKNGWFILFNDGRPAGRFGCWKSGIDQSWSAQAEHHMSATERAAHLGRMRRAAEARDVERRRVQFQAAERAANIWAIVEQVRSDHPYLVRKGVGAHGVGLYKSRLIVPLRDADGTLHSLQFIADTGEKRFLTGGRKSSCCHIIGEIAGDGVAIITEGYATAATIHEATGHPAIVAFDSGNLKSVAEALRAKRPSLRIIVAADNDQWTEGNPGVTKAAEAAQAVGGTVVIPQFADTTTKPTDFNDLGALAGVEAVRAQLAAAVDAKAEGSTGADRDAIIGAAILAGSSDPGKLFEAPIIAALAELRAGDLPGAGAHQARLQGRIGRRGGPRPPRARRRGLKRRGVGRRAPRPSHSRERGSLS